MQYSMGGLRLVALLVSLSVAAAAGTGVSSALSANPIRRVVTMLQEMQHTVEEEGKKEKALFDEFMCFCQTGEGDLSAEVAAAEAKLPQTQSAVGESEALKDQLVKETAQHRQDLADANDSVAEATALREKEAAAFAKESTEAQTNIEALTKAIAALEHGTGASFLQTSEAAALRRLSLAADMDSEDRDLLSSFLAAGQDGAMGAPSSEIIGILQQMKETMEKDLADRVAEEKKTAAEFQALAAAKALEIEAATKAVETKLERAGQLGVEIVTLKEDLEDTIASLEKNRVFLGDLAKNCATKQSEWDERSKIRVDEMVALADTIKILNDDSALDLFKDTLSSPSLLQVQVSSKEVKEQAVRSLTSARDSRDPRMDLILLKLRSRGGNFDEVLVLIDDMASVLVKEQSDDDAKQQYCATELTKHEGNKKELDRTAADLGKSIAEAKGTITATAEEIAALGQSIQDMDKQVTQATETRKAEHEEFVNLLASNNGAKGLLEMAKHRLAKFYTPKLQQQDAPVLVQVSSHHASFRQRPGTAPGTWGAEYEKQGQAQAGVLAMLDVLVADLDKEVHEATVDESHGQGAFERFVHDAAEKRAADARSIAEKEGAKADLEAQVQKMSEQEKEAQAEAMAKAELIVDLHRDCDWLVSNFDVRKEARAGEVESLNRAKAVLSGADYSLLQLTARVARLRGVARLGA